MPSGSYKKADVECCFYRSDDGRSRINCEGLKYSDKQSHIGVYYSKKADFAEHMHKFCCQGYRQCPLYGILMRKYEERRE